MTQIILVLNAGSSSIKFSIFDVGDNVETLTLSYNGQVEGIGVNPHFVAYDATGKLLTDEKLGSPSVYHNNHGYALNILLDWIVEHVEGSTLIAAGHRVVHGGVHYSTPTRTTPEVIDILETLIPLAPLHQPHNLSTIKAITKIKPELPQVACFDTAFHRHQPQIAQTFALPRHLTASGVKRYGFHGLSYEYIMHVLPKFTGDAVANGRVIVAHLGNGCSMSAIQNRQSMSNTFGFSTMDGIPMGTRCGALDAGIVLYLLEECNMTVAGVTQLLYKESGLLGVSGISSDMRELLENDSPQAREAVDLFVYRVYRTLGEFAAVLQGLDVLVFTGGIGQHAHQIRQEICQQATWLGVHIDEAANERGESCISQSDSPVSVWVIPTNEELMIARHTFECCDKLPKT